VIGGIIAVVVLRSRRRRKGPYDRP
jgi:hypothetical protein